MLDHEDVSSSCSTETSKLVWSWECSCSCMSSWYWMCRYARLRRQIYMCICVGLCDSGRISVLMLWAGWRQRTNKKSIAKLVLWFSQESQHSMLQRMCSAVSDAWYVRLSLWNINLRQFYQSKHVCTDTETCVYIKIKITKGSVNYNEIGILSVWMLYGHCIDLKRLWILLI